MSENDAAWLRLVADVNDRDRQDYGPDAVALNRYATNRLRRVADKLERLERRAN